MLAQDRGHENSCAAPPLGTRAGEQRKKVRCFGLHAGLGVVFSFLAATLDAQTVADHAGQDPRARSQPGAVLAERQLVDEAFAKAAQLERQGRTSDAIRLYRSIVRAVPGHIPARRRLVSLLLKTGNIEAAEHHLEALLELDPDPEYRAGYGRIAARLAARRPYGVSATVSLLPSSNVNRGSGRSIFESDLGDFVIDESGREQSGIGVAFSLSGFRRYVVWGGSTLRLDLGGSAQLYEEEEFNRAAVSAGATLQVPLRAGNWTYGADFARVFSGGDVEYDAIGAVLGRLIVVDRARAIRLSARAESRNYDQADYLDGERYRLSASFQNRFSPRLAAEISAGLNIGELNASHYRYDGREIGARLHLSRPSGVRTSIGLIHEHRPYRGNFTGVSYPRTDDITTLELTFMNDSWEILGSSPVLRCRSVWSSSNVSFYDYTVRECAISLTKRF